MRTRIRTVDGLEDALHALRERLEVPGDFPPDVLEAAASARPPDVRRRDARDVDLLTLDPPGSRDLDQAVHIERRGDGHRVRYAIADVGAFVAAGGPVDAEAWRRGVTLYLPDGRAPLHPASLSEGAASLLPGQERPALLWTFDLDNTGAPTATTFERAVVRSRRAWSYPEAAAALADGSAPATLALLAEVGGHRQALEITRGAVSLDLPAQEVRHEGGGYVLAYDSPLPIEGWNAQISLLTGMAAAERMGAAGLGIVRTLPPPDPGTIDRLRLTATALGVRWTAAMTYADVVHALDRRRDADLAFLTQAARLFRGAGYERIATTATPPEHAALAAPYAHVTAPLRRLVDRFANEALLVAAEGRAVPGWLDEALGRLPDAMAAATRRERAVERAVVDSVEAAALTGPATTRLLRGVVVDHAKAGLVVQVAEPAVVVTVRGDIPLGREVQVRVTGTDIAAGRVDAELVLPGAQAVSGALPR